MYQNYVFDLYGTLINIHTDESGKNFFKKYAKWLRKRGYAFSWKDFYEAYTQKERQYREETARLTSPDPAGLTRPEIQIEAVFDEILQEKGYQVETEEIEELCQNFREISLLYLSLYPDTIECLTKLKEAGKRLYLLSNAQRSFTWQELQRTGLIPYFDGILISSDEGYMKPDSRFFSALCERYKLNKEECLMIGNELQSDIAGAAAFGMDSCFINRAAVFHEPKNPQYTYVSREGSLLEVLQEGR